MVLGTEPDFVGWELVVATADGEDLAQHIEGGVHGADIAVGAQIARSVADDVAGGVIALERVAGNPAIVVLLIVF